MKKLIGILMCALLMGSISTLFAATDGVSGATDATTSASTDETAAASQHADAFTSASVTDYYTSSSWTGKTLGDAIANRDGAWTIATVNPDGSPNIAVAVFGALDAETLMLHLAPNQTGENIIRTGQAMAIIYKYTPDLTIDKSLRNQGAKLVLETVSPAEHQTYQERYESVSPSTYVFRIVEIRPLG